MLWADGRGGDANIATGDLSTIGGGASSVWENFTCWDPYNKESTEGAFEFFEASSAYGISRKWGGGMERGNSISRGGDGFETPRAIQEKMMLASPQPQMFRYQRKIRETFNPNDLGDGYYPTL